MTEDEKYELAVLAEDYETKRLRFENLGYLNISGKTADERSKMAQDYHIADAESQEALHRLIAAKRRINARAAGLT